MVDISNTCFKKDFTEDGQIICLEMSPYDLSQDILLIAFKHKIVLNLLKIEDSLDIEEIAEIKHTVYCTSLSLSPKTCLNSLPNNVVFCSAGNDFKLRIIKTDLKEDNVCKILTGHTNYINDTKFDPEDNYLISVSDDNTAKLWETTDFKIIGTLYLSSPGMSASWHRDDKSKLLIAEKVGIIRFYNVDTQCPILSLDYGTQLSDAQWSPDSQMIGSLQLGELFLWDLTKPCTPISNSILFTESGGYIKFSPYGELLAAINKLEGTFKVINIKNQRQQLSINVMLPTNLCWHYRCPIVCYADYQSLYLWKVTS